MSVRVMTAVGGASILNRYFNSLEFAKKHLEKGDET